MSGIFMGTDRCEIDKKFQSEDLKGRNLLEF
jgi:hypothetical protein